MEVAALVEKVSERAHRQVARATLVGMIAEKVFQPPRT
jgi:hypothetical protein